MLKMFKKLFASNSLETVEAIPTLGCIRWGGVWDANTLYPFGNYVPTQTNVVVYNNILYLNIAQATKGKSPTQEPAAWTQFGLVNTGSFVNNTLIDSTTTVVSATVSKSIQTSLNTYAEANNTMVNGLSTQIGSLVVQTVAAGDTTHAPSSDAVSKAIAGISTGQAGLIGCSLRVSTTVVPVSANTGTATAILNAVGTGEAQQKVANSYKLDTTTASSAYFSDSSSSTFGIAIKKAGTYRVRLFMSANASFKSATGLGIAVALNSSQVTKSYTSVGKAGSTNSSSITEALPSSEVIVTVAAGDTIGVALNTGGLINSGTYVGLSGFLSVDLLQ